MNGCLCKKCHSETCWNAGHDTYITSCSVFVPPEPISHYDEICSMSIEEMAWELTRICRMPFYKDDSEIDEYEVDCWAKWLKQEASK